MLIKTARSTPVKPSSDIEMSYFLANVTFKDLFTFIIKNN